MGFPGYGLVPVSFVFRGQYDAVWGFHPVEKARRRRTQAAELGCLGNIHGCRQDACPAILPAENQGKGMRTPAIPASCSDHDEAGGGNLPGFLDVFPAVTSKRLSGFHGYSKYEGISSPAASVWRTRRVVAGEWKTARKDCPSPRRLFVLSAPQYRRSFNFRFAGRKNRFPGLSKFQVLMRRPKGHTTPLAVAPP